MYLWIFLNLPAISQRLEGGASLAFNLDNEEEHGEDSPVDAREEKEEEDRINGREG